MTSPAQPNPRNKRLKQTLTEQRLPLAIAVLAAILLLSALIYWVILPRQLTFIAASNGTVSHEYPAVLLIANTETLVLSPADGTPAYTKPDGSRFRRGEKIAEIGKKEITAPIAGLYFAGKDGLEGILTPSALTGMDLQKLMNEINVIMPETAKITQPATTANSGPNPGATAWAKPQPITQTTANGIAGKMVNNLEPSWAFISLPKEGLDTGAALQFKIGNTTEKAYVERISDNPEGVVVRFVHFLEPSSAQRVLFSSWIQKQPQQGIVVPLSALVRNGAETGLYCVEAGIIVYKSDIRIVDQNEDLACIEGVNAETRVVTNPREGIAGKKVR